MMEKELADTEARQEKVDHKLKERIGKYKENQKKGESVAHTERIWDLSFPANTGKKTAVDSIHHFLCPMLLIK